MILLIVVSFVWQTLHRIGTGRTGDGGEVVVGAGAGTGAGVRVGAGVGIRDSVASDTSEAVGVISE